MRMTVVTTRCLTASMRTDEKSPTAERWRLPSYRPAARSAARQDAVHVTSPLVSGVVVR